MQAVFGHPNNELNRILRSRFNRVACRTATPPSSPAGWVSRAGPYFYGWTKQKL